MSKQKLIIIADSPCVGKTTVTQELFASYENSAFLTAIGHGVSTRFQLMIRDCEMVTKQCHLHCLPI